MEKNSRCGASRSILDDKVTAGGQEKLNEVHADEKDANKQRKPINSYNY